MAILAKSGYRDKTKKPSVIGAPKAPTVTSQPRGGSKFARTAAAMATSPPLMAPRGANAPAAIAAVEKFVSSVINAPGQEFALGGPTAMPGMVYQKVGVPALRRLISKQAAPYLERPTPTAAASPFAGALPQEVKVAKLATPIIDRNVAKVAEAATGRAINLVGFRAQAKGGPVPGRGMHYSAVPWGARPYTPEKFHPQGLSKSSSVIKLRNPYVLHHGDQERLVQQLMKAPEQISPKLRKAGQTLMRSRLERLKTPLTGIPETWYTKADKWITKVLKERGHDGLIYSGQREIVDFGGTVTRKAAK